MKINNQVSERFLRSNAGEACYSRPNYLSGPSLSVPACSGQIAEIQLSRLYAHIHLNIDCQQRGTGRNLEEGRRLGKSVDHRNVAFIQQAKRLCRFACAHTRLLFLTLKCCNMRLQSKKRASIEILMKPLVGARAIDAKPLY